MGRAIGNKVYNWFASYVTKFDVRDLTSGFRAIKTEIARSFLYLLPNTYSYPTTITLGVLRNGNSVKYMPIRTQKRTQGKSQIRLFQDGVRFFMIITRIATLYSPMRVFLPVSFTLFMLGLMRYVYTLITEGRFTNMSALFFVSSITIFMMSLISEQICQMRYRGGPHRGVPKKIPWWINETAGRTIVEKNIAPPSHTGAHIDFPALAGRYRAAVRVGVMPSFDLPLRGSCSGPPL